MSKSDDGKPPRDANGRWLSGRSPNPDGRPPKKQPKVLAGQSDIHTFGNTLVEIVINGEAVLMDRRASLRYRQYESAMKGSVSAQRDLHKEFAKNDELHATCRGLYEDLVAEWLIDDQGRNKPFEKIPSKIKLEIISLGTTLNHYYPGSCGEVEWLLRKMDENGR
jgi:hypothetical protein